MSGKGPEEAPDCATGLDKAGARKLRLYRAKMSKR